jgi:16S rRNA (guanine(966)-N(2))-methyltransferase RsmD
MAREGLFNILSNVFDFASLRVADLFAGTGSISMEFASRGCNDITSVDSHPGCVRFMKETTASLRISAVRIVRNDVFRFIRKPLATYQIIFADPPYNLKQIKDLPDLILEQDLLGEGGWLILEHSSRNSFDNHPFFFQHRKYGEVNFTIFRKGQGSPDHLL